MDLDTKALLVTDKYLMLTSDTTSCSMEETVQSRREAKRVSVTVANTTCLCCSGGDGAVQKKVRCVSTVAPAMQRAVQARAPEVPTAHPGASAGPLPQQHPVSSAHSLHR